MVLLILALLGALVGCGLCASPVSTCKDLDTSACLLFQAAKPDLCSDPAFSMSTCQRFCGNCPLECYTCPTPVLNPTDCNTTSTCGTNMTCMTKHLHALDGHDEYIMTCEKKEICEGFGLGFPFGKRDVHAPERYERDVSLSCCDTDFCNFPFLTTSTTSTVRPTTPTPSGCKRDVVFVLDDSGSVGTANFKLQLDFAKAVINQLPVGPYEAQVAMMAFSSHPQVEWYLNSFGTQAEIINAIPKVRYLGGVTRTGDALEAVRTQMFQYAHGDRSSADNVVIVLTDGNSNDKSDTIHEANNLHRVSHDVISIVVGSGVDLNELNAIATDRHHVFDVRRYSDLNTLIPQVLDLVCTA